jgi:hypothetical protein
MLSAKVIARRARGSRPCDVQDRGPAQPIVSLLVLDQVIFADTEKFHFHRKAIGENNGSGYSTIIPN